MKKYWAEVRVLIGGIKHSEIEAIPSEENQEDDALNKYAIGVSLWQELHYVETSKPLTIEVWEPSKEVTTWMKPI